MDMKRLSLVKRRRIDSLETCCFNFCKSLEISVFECSNCMFSVLSDGFQLFLNMIKLEQDMFYCICSIGDGTGGGGEYGSGDGAQLASRKQDNGVRYG